MSERQQVAVVTGGGGGIGAAIAEELGRGGWNVVTMDPLVTLDGSERLRRAGGDHCRSHRGSGRLGPGLVGVGHRRRRGARPVPGAGRRTRRARRRGQRRRHHAAHRFRRGYRGGMARRARRAPRGLPERAQCRAAAHGRRRARQHPRRHLRVGVASCRCRGLQLRQAGHRLPHLAAGAAGAAGRDHQRDVTDRSHPNGRRCHRARSSGGQGLRWGRTLARVGAAAPRTSGPSAPSSSTTGSGGAAAACSSPAARRWRSSTSRACSRWCGATAWSASPGCSGPSSRAPSPRPRPAR